MSLALLRSRALTGLEAPLVSVEVHLANGLPVFNIVGLADTEVRESRERVRAAILNSGLEFPSRRITQIFWTHPYNQKELLRLERRQAAVQLTSTN